VLRQLDPQKADIEAALGEPLDWNPHPEKQDKIIRLIKHADIADRSAWPKIIAWLTERAVSFKQAFGPRLLAMDVSSSDVAEEA
jgi:uncharacterized protein DUF4268